ncbi:MAG TPA: alpha/beta fold hydrolase [Stellaceae bacterium]|nr:alpha/beta fold hydrolase [Stellaceae bacterium]
MRASKGGIEINYVTEGSGPPVTLVHGVGANLESWDAITASLARRYRVVRMDLRGHGRSSRIETCRLQDFLDDVTLVLDALGIARTHFVGFSLGGMIAQAFVLAHPERVERLALISAVAGRTPEERASVQARGLRVQQEGIASVSAAAQDRWFTEDFRRKHPDVVARRIEELKANDHRSYATAYAAFAEGDLGPRLHEIRHPTLIITGEHDIGSNPRMARFMHDAIPGSTLHILPKLKHSVLLEAPAAIAALLLDFLSA